LRRVSKLDGDEVEGGGHGNGQVGLGDFV
jgi:hypothetical protein